MGSPFELWQFVCSVLPSCQLDLVIGAERHTCLSPGSTKTAASTVEPACQRKPWRHSKCEHTISFSILPILFTIMESFVLEGAPDASIGLPEAKTSAAQVMHLEMSNDILDDLLACIRKGRAPQVLFGKTPLIKYDGKSHELHTKPEKFRYELYRENQENEGEPWEFNGLINHSLSIQHVQEASAGTDRALEALKNTMASIEQEREARKAAISTPESRPMKAMSKAQSRATHLKPLLAGSGRSTPGSPSFGSSTPAHLRPPPTSAGLDMPFDIAIRKPLVHLLAVQPLPYLKIRRTVGTNPKKILEKVAKPTGKGDEEWALLDRAYKELDVFEFKYSEEDRQAAIENAIRAFDRMRLPKDDPLWQKLLPKADRGKGITLSKLALKDPAKMSTPTVKAQSINKKTDFLTQKKKDQKKPEKEGAAKAKKAKEGAMEEKPRAMKSAAESSTRTPKVEPRRDRDRHAAPKRAEDNGRSPAGKQTKPSAAAKGLLNKPKNLSPLGVSPPVNASDFDDGHPVHKRLSAATSPRSSAKRKADDINGAPSTSATSNKRPHIDSQSSSSSEERPVKAAKTVPTKSVPTSSNKTNGLNGHGHANGRVSPGDSDSSSSSGGPPLRLSWRQSLDMARKFNIYYERYKKLYIELSESDTPPTEKKREELLEMHKRLEKMKRDVHNGAL